MGEVLLLLGQRGRHVVLIASAGTPSTLTTILLRFSILQLAPNSNLAKESNGAEPSVHSPLIVMVPPNPGYKYGDKYHANTPHQILNISATAGFFSFGSLPTGNKYGPNSDFQFGRIFFDEFSFIRKSGGKA